jgi:hypothetical protein
MLALRARWLGLLQSTSDVRAQIVYSLLVLRVTCHRAVPLAVQVIALLLYTFFFSRHMLEAALWRSANAYWTPPAEV